MRFPCTWVPFSISLLLACGDAADDGGAAEASGSGSSGGTTGTSASASATTTAGTTAGSASTTAGSASTTAGTATSAATDTATTDGTADSGGSSSTGAAPGDCSEALLCDDFEAHAAGAQPGAPWQSSTQQGSITVDDGKAYSGSQSVRFDIEGGGGTYRRAFMSIEGAPVFARPRDAIWGRMMVWLDATPTGSVHWTNIQGEGDVPDMGFRGLYRYGGQHDGRIMANYETQGAGSDCWQHSQTVMPTATWACIEWHYAQSTDTMEYFLDGMQLDDLTVVGQGEGCISHDTGDHWYAPLFDTMRLGWEHYQQTDAKQLWIDDVAMDVARIGCPP